MKTCLPWTNFKFRNREKPKASTFASNVDNSVRPKNSKRSFKDGQHAIWSCEKFKSMKERREHVQKFRLRFNCLRPGHRSKDCKSRTCSMYDNNKFLHWDFSMREAATGDPDSTTALARNITQRRFLVVRIKLVNRNNSLSVLAICDTGILNFIRRQVNRIYTAPARPKSVFVISSNPWVTLC